MDSGKSRLRRVALLPLAILLFVLLAGNAVAAYLLVWRPIFLGSFWVYQIYAFFTAQAGSYCVLSGMLGRAWIASFLIGAVWTVAAALVFCFYWTSAEITAFICGFIPLLLFCGCLPFLLLRSWFGWHLHRNHDPYVEPYTLRMGDIFVATTVVAGLIAMAVTSYNFMYTVDDADRATRAMGMLLILAAATALSSVTVVPVTVMYFRASTRRRRTLVLLGFGAAGLMAWTGFFGGMALLSQIDPLSLILQVLPPAITSALLFSTGLVVIRASGYRWVVVKASNKPPSGVDVFSQVDQPTAGRAYGRRNLMATLGIVAGSILLSLSISAIQQVRSSIARTYAELNGKLVKDGGYLEHVEHIPIALKVGNSTTDSTLPELSQFADLGRISLAGSPVTETTLKSITKLRSLHDIDLSYTGIDDSALDRLDGKSFLSRLALAGTRVTIEGINRVRDRFPVYGLDIANMDVNDQSLAQLSVSKLNELVLTGNPITDVSFPHISNVRSVDLSGTQCTGKGLGQLVNNSSLVFDNTCVDDAAIKQLLASNKILSRISLRNTHVTDAILVTLQQRTSLTDLAIGDGQITRTGLLAVGFAPPERLSLNSKKFDASLFAVWHPSIRKLDMNDSGVTDDDVIHLANVRGLSELSLANCNLTNACLPKLAKLAVIKLDLSGTHVTAAEVAKHLPKTTVVYLSAAQRSPEQGNQPEQLSAPEQDSNLRIGVRLEFDSNY
ncbi:MAG: hypothetical protein SFV81_05590 [Pirellulaceae bacterium]|nr:hypothetical protein [Pirellulaceae bacterium]